MASYLELFCGVVVLLIVFYYYRISHYNFWKKRGVFGPRPNPIFGNLLDLTLARVSISDVVVNLYKKYKHEPVVGLFDGTSPVLVLHDPDIIKNVLIRDFSSFQERPHTVHERTEPLSPHLVQLDARRWRPIRPKLTPFFTSGKLKEMFTLMVEVSKNLEGYLNDVVGTGKPVEVRELTAQYSTDVIGTCAFGLNMNAVGEENSEFRRIGRQIFEGNMENFLRLKTRLFCPNLYNLLGYVVPEKTLTRFFTKLVMSTIKYRKEHGIYRPDFINALAELHNHPEQIEGVEMTDKLLTALAAGFFAAGFETTSTSMSWTLYELAQNHEIQDKLHEEIKAYHDKYGDTYTIDSLKELKYVDKVFKGSRFANLEAKLGLITILRNHKVDVCEETTIPYEFDKRALLLQPKHGLYLKVTKIE
ncbi:cytochrome P450 6a2-like isoform X2 [Lasioglossum baleicum]|uniref:cytochrome P450 6a2-like isoform X2 n=1 Tax=Lasioglossum baleicum TaxID=434251 RepID=UPI003FCE3827